MKSLSTRLAALLLALSLLAPAVNAQDPAPESAVTEEPESVEQVPEDVLGRGTPSSSISGFLEAASSADFEKAAQYLDLNRLPLEAQQLGGPELARRLNHVISRSVWMDEYTLSNDPDGEQGDGLPDNRDRLVTIEVDWGEVPLWMQRVPRDDGELIWKVSNRSVALIPRLYQEFSYAPVVETIREWFPEDAAFLGFELFKWFILIAVILLSWPVFYFIGLFLLRLFISQDLPTYALWRKVVTGPLVAIAVLVVGSMVFLYLGAGLVAQQIGQAHTLSTLVFIWASWSVINLVRAYQQEKLKAEGRPGAAQLMQPMSTFLKILVLLFAVLFWLNNVGVNITTVLAGLGVGGLALALALQKPLEDMMGALSLFAQAPIKVGDFCKYGNVFGTVEEIGLRSTRLRTLTNTVVHIPNAKIAYSELENLSSRTMIRYWPTLRLRYDTTPEQLRTVLTGIQQMLEQHQQVYDDPLRVRLTDFGDDAILIKLHAFMKTTDFAESLEIAQDLNFRIIDIMHNAGVQFALPGSSIYMEGES